MVPDHRPTDDLEGGEVDPMFVVGFKCRACRS
jgi:hypothetical protein